MRGKVRLKAAIIAAALMLGQISSGAVSAEEKDGGGLGYSVILNENFESYSIGTVSATTLGGGTAKGNGWFIENESGKDNKFFKMVINTSSDAHLDRVISPAASGKFVFEVDICFFDYGNVNKNIQLMSSENKDIPLIGFRPDGTLRTYNGIEIARYALNKYYRVSMLIDTDNQTMSVWFNGKRRIKNHKLAIQDAAKLRIHMTNVKDTSTIGVDNISLYYAEKPLSDEEKKERFEEQGISSATGSGLSVETVMKDAVAMYAGKSNVLINGVKSYISPDKSLKPFETDGKYFVPIGFFGKSIGADVTYSAEENTSKVVLGDKSAIFNLTDKTAVINGESAGSDIFTVNNGSVYASVEVLCSAFGKYLHTEDNGIIIYSSRDLSEILDWSKNLKLMRNISESYMFDDVSGKELADRIISRNPNKKHPRLIMTDSDFEKIRNEVARTDGDRIYKKLYDGLKDKADKYLTQKTSGYEIRDGIRLLAVIRENKERMLNLALMYNLTLDEKYARRAYLEMYTTASFVNWNPYHFLDVGEAAASMGICYDWLYNYMSEAERKPIREAIVKNAIYPIMDDFDDKPRNRSWNWRGELADNWCFVVGGVGVGAMAVVDELSGQDRTNAERAMEQTLIDIRRALSLFAPSGGYEEGINYWGLTMEFYTYMMKSLETAVGEEFGYVDVPGMRNTNNYIFSMNGSVSTFSYHDTGMSSSLIPPQTLFLAERFGNYAEAQPRINQILTGAATVMDMCLYKCEFSSAAKNDSPLDVYMPIAETVTMRSGWNRNDTYVGFHCDDPYGSSGHDHMDSGVFVLDAMGENFFTDLGSDSYNLQPYHDTYRFRAEGHNTIVLNPSKDYGQKFGGKANIEEYKFSETGGYVIGNLTEAYDENLSESMRRGVKLDNYRRMVTVQDEVRLKEKSDFWWFAHTKAEIEISEDGKSAVLDRNGKKLLAKIISGDGASFSVMEAKPLPTSPEVKGQDKNEGFSKLTVHIPECQTLDLGIVFISYDQAYEAENYDFTYKPLDEWEAPQGKMSDLLKATVDSIKINSVPLDGFSPDIFDYEVPVTSLSNEDDNIEVSAEGEYEIIKKTELIGETKIIASRNGKKEKSVYTLKYNIKPEYTQPTGKERIVPVSVKASSVPQPENSPENTIDGSLNTRWSCAKECWIEYDLGSVKSLDSVGVAFMDGTSRTAQFEIELSEDGLNYTKYFAGDSLPTLELDNHKLFGANARYVRINCYGYDNNRSQWNSITEFVCYAQ